jgi:hypothetical protein
VHIADLRVVAAAGAGPEHPHGDAGRVRLVADHEGDAGHDGEDDEAVAPLGTAADLEQPVVPLIPVPNEEES